MTKVWCPCVDCKYNKDNRCESKELHFKFSEKVAFTGKLKVWTCDQYLPKQENQEIMSQLDDYTPIK